jgi:hypothetical protein
MGADEAVEALEGETEDMEGKRAGGLVHGAGGGTLRLHRLIDQNTQQLWIN